MSEPKPRRPFPEKGGHPCGNVTFHDLPPLPAWVVEQPKPRCTKPDCGCDCHNEEQRW